MPFHLGRCLSRYLGGPCYLGAACHGRWPVRLPFPMRVPWLAYAPLATQFYDLHHTGACFGCLSLDHSWPECHITWQASFPLWAGLWMPCWCILVFSTSSRFAFIISVRSPLCFQRRCVHEPPYPRFCFGSGELLFATCDAWLLLYSLTYCFLCAVGCDGAPNHGRWPVRLPLPMRMPLPILRSA
ncbi:hypothetical protein V6N13_096756 [Hibiscus sabdariffa]